MAILGIGPDGLASLIRRCRLPATGNSRTRRYPQETGRGAGERLSRPPGMQTSNHYLAAIKSFARWLDDGDRLTRNPLAKLRGGNVLKDLRHARRTLPLTELTKLFQATAASQRTFRGLTGPDRLALYLTACGTGFRAGELAVLGPESFDLDAELPVVVLPAREDKAGRPVTQPLSPGLVAVLRDYLAGRALGLPVLAGLLACGRGADDPGRPRRGRHPLRHHRRRWAALLRLP